ncbi:MAG: Uma2 family endonuclease [Labilithrix sp.]|nr:Uma2 family endonuclease [Labilithrix sp.]MCW5813785.1 Uma2 family endonuclease [Labilithrix sp.]
MAHAAASPYVNFDDYFEAEATAGADALKHEWCDGVVYGMSRGTPEHGRLVYRASLVLGAALPAECTGYASDTMLHIEAARLSTYADLSIVCGPLETITVYKNGKSLGQAITNPVVVVEVLSSATERYDRDGKFQAYKQLASLREYVLISQDERRIEVFRREDGWKGEGAGAGSIRVHGQLIAIDDVYR